MLKWLVSLMITISVIINIPTIGNASSDEANTLLLYSVNTEKEMKEVRILDTLIGQFSTDMTVRAAEDFQTDEWNEYTHVIYYGVSEKKLPENVVRAAENYQGAFFALGHNYEQLNESFSFFAVSGETLVSGFQLPQTDHVFTMQEDRIIFQLDVQSQATVFIQGIHDEEKDIPMLVGSGKHYYFAGQTLFDPFGKGVGEFLNTFYNDTEGKKVRYLRLEDIHPRVDPHQLRAVADYLKDKDIPYMVAVIPVYVDGENTFHFSDATRLVDTLQYMQRNGASIVLHGYRHQYRTSETGEGFEFWDVENDRPIYQGQEDPILLKEDFTSEKEYQAFIEEGRAFERTYTIDAITNGVKELVAHDLYPLAFEAPHYTMSQQGYEVLADHFSTYVGRLQLTDVTWKGAYAPSSKSKPSFLHGMTLYPETIGHIEESNKEASQEQMVQNIIDQQKLTKSYIAGFYHPYLGLDSLKEVVTHLESIENAEWLDLKAEENSVHVEGVAIESKAGEIDIEKEWITGDYEQAIFVQISLNGVFQSFS
ncbi:DUF2334 domain-containing protein [Bacillaceae bacterium SIJ1]|uniref:DUF2334 domain-containing protein n=1 Tax=Litoribacterium kuwaitense TaxID=1398745 RepID=UPI0013EA1CFA|nr:DUF2334 domain-containing protein [Litoribacterium kuwaitense]NGP45304.1 DUF2334 domain-containing protein [Litoribacterium kuwaitense]